MTDETPEQPPPRGHEASPAEQPTDPVPAELAGALARCLAEIERNPAPTGFNQRFGYKFLSIAQVTDLVRPLMGRNGLALLVSVVGTNRRDWGRQTLTTVKLQCTFAHESGATYTRIWYGEACDPQGHDKGLNKAYTAGLKQCLLKTFLLADGEEDPDGDGDDKAGGKGSKATPHQPRPDKRDGEPKKRNKPKPDSKAARSQAPDRSKPPAGKATGAKAYNRRKAWREAHAALDELIETAAAVDPELFKRALHHRWHVESTAYVPEDKLQGLVDWFRKLDHPSDAETETERELRMLKLIADELGELPEPPPSQEGE